MDWKHRQIRIAQLLMLLVGGGVAAQARADYFVGAAVRAQALQRIEQLAEIQRRREDALFNLPGVFAVGISFDKSSREFFFQVRYDSAGPAPALPSFIEGVPVVGKEGVPAVPANGAAGGCLVCHGDQQSLPAEMGNSGDNNLDFTCSTCTMGFKACDTQTGETVWVTNAHCSTDGTYCPGSAPLGTRTYHVAPGDDPGPSCSPGDDVGEVTGHAIPSCAGGSRVDATKIASDDSLTQWSIRDIGVPADTTATVCPWDAVQKSGRTTGFTAGWVDAVNVNIRGAYACCATAPKLNDLFAMEYYTPVCELGDSGSAVLDSANPPHLVGQISLGTGKTCWATEIDHVLAALDLSLDRAYCLDECQLETVLAGQPDPDPQLRQARALRDEVLSQTDLGKRFVRDYYATKPAWVALYAAHPALLSQTSALLVQNMGIVSALRARQPVEVTLAQLGAMDAFFAAHIGAAGPGALADAFVRWRDAMHDPAVQRAFLVTVAGGAPDYDHDGAADRADNCPNVANAAQADLDRDEVGDACDNCVAVANPRVGPDYLYVNAWAALTGGQRDDDHDGFGNPCDAKFTVSGTTVGEADALELRASMGKSRDDSSCGTTGHEPCAVFDLDQRVEQIGGADLSRFKQLYGQPPGPKCPACPLACDAGVARRCSSPLVHQ